MTLALSGQDRGPVGLRSRCHVLLNSNALCPQESHYHTLFFLRAPHEPQDWARSSSLLFSGCSAVALEAGPKPAFSIFISAEVFPWALFAFLYISAVCVVEISFKFLLLLPCWLSGKESACQCRRHRRRGFNPWVGKIPWRKAWLFLPGKANGQRRLVGYSLWGHKESGTTEHGENTHTHTHTHTHTPSHTYLPKEVCPPKSAFLEGELHTHAHTHTLLLTLIFRKLSAPLTQLS